MKQKRIKVAKFIIFIMLALLALYGAVLVTERKQSHAKYHDFFARSDQIDILLLGNSHVVNGLRPLKLYAETGFTSYNMGGFGAPMNATYWTLMNALDYCTPELVIVDTNFLYRDYQYIDRPEGPTAIGLNAAVEELHLNLDAFSYSGTKKAAIEDLIIDPSIRNQFLYPASTYHNRWRELEWNDFLRLTERDAHNRRLGEEMNYGIIRNMFPMEYTEDVPDDQETVCTTYLRRILDECRERQIGAIVTYLPFNGQPEDIADAMTAKRIAAGYDVPFLNFLDPAIQTEAGIDLRTDLNDNGHLNVFGADKVTDYLAGFLKNTNIRDLVDHRNDPAYASWDRLCEICDTEEAAELRGTDDPFFLLDIILHKKQRAVIFLRDDSALLKDADMRYLLGKFSPASRVPEAFLKNESYLLLYDGQAAPVEAVGSDSFEDRITFLGKTSLVSSGPFHRLYTNGEFESNFLDMDTYFNSDLQIILFEPEQTVYRYYTADALTFEMHRR